MHVMVAVVTLDRPEPLRRCIESIVALEPPPDTTVSVVVVDNGSQISARSLVTGSVTVLDHPVRGVTFTRNRALDHAESEGIDLLAFIDDDETCEPDWLATLVDAQRRTGAGVVTGPSVSDFDGQVVPPALAAYFEVPDWPDLSTRLEAYTGNVAFTRSCFAGPGGLRFDSAFNHSGGEDTDFSRRLHASGRRIVWCAGAIVHNHIAPERLTWKWVLSRQVSLGERRAAVLLAEGKVSRLRIAGYGLSAVGYGVALAIGQVARRRPPLTVLRPALIGVGCLLRVGGLASQTEVYG